MLSDTVVQRFLERTIVIWLVNKYHSKIHYHVQKIPALDPITSHFTALNEFPYMYTFS